MKVARVIFLGLSVSFSLLSSFAHSSEALLSGAFDEKATYFWQTKWLNLDDYSSQVSTKEISAWPRSIYSPKCVSGHGVLGVKGSQGELSVVKLNSGAFRLIGPMTSLRANLITAQPSKSCSDSQGTTILGSGASAKQTKFKIENCEVSLPAYEDHMLDVTACSGALCKLISSRLTDAEVIQSFDVKSDVVERKTALIKEVTAKYPEAQVFAHRAFFGLDWDRVLHTMSKDERAFLDSRKQIETDLQYEEQHPIIRVQQAVLKAQTLETCCQDSACSATLN